MSEKRVVVGIWTDEEKDLMAKVSFEVIDLLKKRLKDRLMVAHCMNIMNSVFKEDVGIQKIMYATKDGEIKKNLVERVLKIIHGMQVSDVNLILFRDCPEVWMQYYMGLYFNRPTFIISLGKHKKIVDKLLNDELVVQVEYIDSFNEVSIRDVMLKLKDKMEVVGKK